MTGEPQTPDEVAAWVHGIVRKAMEGAEAQAVASAVDALCEGGQPLSPDTLSSGSRGQTRRLDGLSKGIASTTRYDNHVKSLLVRIFLMLDNAAYDASAGQRSGCGALVG